MLATETINSDFHPSALTEIYQDMVSMSVWKRQLDTGVEAYAQTLLNQKRCFQTRFIQSPLRVAEQLEKELPLNKHRQSYIEDVALVVDMFACLFDIESIGIRMAVLDAAMCPKFHVDRVPCRLVCTYAGAGTEWHPNEQVRRFEDGTLEPLPEAKPQTLSMGDVALLKGEAWEGNEGRGLVHRSPSATGTTRRLLLTLDFA